MTIPENADTRLRNFYQAHLSGTGGGAMSVLKVSLDAVHIPAKVALVKIDVEGHEFSVLKGM